MWNLENGRTQQQARYLWLSAVILVNLEAEIRRILVQSQSGQMLHETLFQKYWAHGCTHMRTRTHTHKPTQETPATNLRKKTKDNTNIKRLAGIVAHWYSTCLASTSPWFRSLAQQKKKKKKKKIQWQKWHRLTDLNISRNTFICEYLIPHWWEGPLPLTQLIPEFRREM
jgi:hypothetical protein